MISVFIISVLLYSSLFTSIPQGGVTRNIIGILFVWDFIIHGGENVVAEVSYVASCCETREKPLLLTCLSIKHALMQVLLL